MIWFTADGLLFASALSPHHLSPILRNFTDRTIIDRWLAVLDELIAARPEIQRILCGISGDLERAQLIGRRRYIQDLWDGVAQVAENVAGNPSFSSEQETADIISLLQPTLAVLLLPQALSGAPFDENALRAQIKEKLFFGRLFLAKPNDKIPF